MDIKQRINKFNTENRPFYIVDHESGEYSLCLALSFRAGGIQPICGGDWRACDGKRALVHTWERA